ncbi:hypothetical protein Tco_1421211 [Tanacetum coccineum]
MFLGMIGSSSTLDVIYEGTADSRNGVVQLFGVGNWTDYNDESEPITFGRRVFSSSLDGQPIRGKHVEALINSVLSYGIYGVCIGILACRGLSLVSSPLHAMKSQSQIQSSAAVKFGGVTDCVPTLISQSLGPSRKRSRSPSSPFFPDAITFSDGKPASETSELNPEDMTARLEDMEVEIDTLHADTEDKELLISELQDSLAAAENEIAMLQIRVADADDRRVEDHDQIQKKLARLGL